MTKYESPSFHLVELSGPLDCREIAALPDAELEAYLTEHGYEKNKRLYRANGNYVCRRIAGEAMLVPVGDVPGNVMLALSDTCCFLWEQLQEPKTVADLIAAARSEYDDPEHTLEAQVREFVEDCIKTGHIWEVK